jgi:hypothetical protein
MRDLQNGFNFYAYTAKQILVHLTKTFKGPATGAVSLT